MGKEVVVPAYSSRPRHAAPDRADLEAFFASERVPRDDWRSFGWTPEPGIGETLSGVYSDLYFSTLFRIRTYQSGCEGTDGSSSREADAVRLLYIPWDAFAATETAAGRPPQGETAASRERDIAARWVESLMLPPDIRALWEARLETDAERESYRELTGRIGDAAVKYIDRLPHLLAADAGLMVAYTVGAVSPEALPYASIAGQALALSKSDSKAGTWDAVNDIRRISNAAAATLDAFLDVDHRKADRAQFRGEQPSGLAVFGAGVNRVTAEVSLLNARLEFIGRIAGFGAGLAGLGLAGIREPSVLPRLAVNAVLGSSFAIAGRAYANRLTANAHGEFRKLMGIVETNRQEYARTAKTDPERAAGLLAGIYDATDRLTSMFNSYNRSVMRLRESIPWWSGMLGALTRLDTSGLVIGTLLSSSALGETDIVFGWIGAARAWASQYANLAVLLSSMRPVEQGGVDTMHRGPGLLVLGRIPVRSRAGEPSRVIDVGGLSLVPGTYAVIGPSGSGKTTLLDAVARPHTHPEEAVKDGAGSLRTRYTPESWSGYVTTSFLGDETADYLGVDIVGRIRRGRGNGILSLIAQPDGTRRDDAVRHELMATLGDPSGRRTLCAEWQRLYTEPGYEAGPLVREADRILSAYLSGFLPDSHTDTGTLLRSRIGTKTGASYGEGRRLGLALALLDEPVHDGAHVYLLDEPTSGLEPKTRRAIVRQLMTFLSSHPGDIIIVTTNDDTFLRTLRDPMEQGNSFRGTIDVKTGIFTAAETGEQYIASRVRARMAESAEGSVDPVSALRDAELVIGEAETDTDADFREELIRMTDAFYNTVPALRTVTDGLGVLKHEDVRGILRQVSSLFDQLALKSRPWQRLFAGQSLDDPAASVPLTRILRDVQMMMWRLDRWMISDGAGPERHFTRDAIRRVFADDPDIRSVWTSLGDARLRSRALLRHRMQLILRDRAGEVGAGYVRETPESVMAIPDRTIEDQIRYVLWESAADRRFMTTFVDLWMTDWETIRRRIVTEKPDQERMTVIRDMLLPADPAQVAALADYVDHVPSQIADAYWQAAMAADAVSRGTAG